MSIMDLKRTVMGVAVLGLFFGCVVQSNHQPSIRTEENNIVLKSDTDIYFEVGSLTNRSLISFKEISDTSIRHSGELSETKETIQIQFDEMSTLQSKVIASLKEEQGKTQEAQNKLIALQAEKLSTQALRLETLTNQINKLANSLESCNSSTRANTVDIAQLTRISNDNNNLVLSPEMLPLETKSWEIPPTNVVSVAFADGSRVRAQKCVEDNTDQCCFTVTNKFEVDPLQSYEFSVWILSPENSEKMTHYFGYYVYDKDGKKIDGDWKNKYFHNDSKPTEWTHWSGIVSPFDSGNVQVNRTIGTDQVFPKTAKYAALRFGSCGGDGKNKAASHFTFPQVKAKSPEVAAIAKATDELFGLGPVGTNSNPGISCKQILEQERSSKSGWFSLKISTKTELFYCDMEEDEGGWTAVIDPTKGVVPSLSNAPGASWSQAQYFDANHRNGGAGGNKRYPEKSFGVINGNSRDRGGRGYQKGRFKTSFPAFTQIRVRSAGGEVCQRRSGSVTTFKWGNCGGPGADWIGRLFYKSSNYGCSAAFHGENGYGPYHSWGDVVGPVRTNDKLSCAAQTDTFVEFGSECGTQRCSSNGFAKWESYYVR